MNNCGEQNCVCAITIDNFTYGAHLVQAGGLCVSCNHLIGSHKQGSLVA
jgi:hypothetical protein